MTSQSSTLNSGSQAFPDPIPGIIPFGSLCVVAGASGAGKTILIAEWLQRMRAGRTICGHATNPSTDYYVIAADRDWRTYDRAFRAAGFPEIKRYVLAEDKEFDPQNWGRKQSAFTLFERCIERLEPIPGSWVNVDPVAPLFIQGNQNDARDVALSLHWYRKMTLKYQITLALFANVGKQKMEEIYRRAQDHIAGSGAFVAYSDTQISIEQDEHGVMSMQWTPRNHEAEEFLFKFDKATTLFVPYTPKRDSEDGQMPESRLAVLNLIPDQGITSPELVRDGVKAGISRSTTFRALRDLQELGLIDRTKDGVVTKRPPLDKPPS